MQKQHATEIVTESTISINTKTTETEAIITTRLLLSGGASIIKEQSESQNYAVELATS